jgi:hypothetical protein
MDACDVKVEFDRESRAYAAGEPVSGRVLVQARSEVRVRRVTVGWEWRSRAGAITESGPREEIELSGPENLASGDTREYAFRFEAPASPLTYRGRLITLEWRLVATVEYDRRTVAESTFILSAGDASGRSAYEWEHNRERTRQARVYGHPATPPVVWLVGVLGAGFVAVGGVLIVRAVIGASSETVQQLIVGAIVLAFGLLGVWQVVAAGRARRTAGGISLVIATPVVRANETLRVSLDAPASAGRITSARLVLTCEEEAIQNAAGGGTSVRRNVVRETEIARNDTVAAPGQPVRLQAAVRVPPNSPLSFHGRSTSVNWLVEARLTLPFAPDFRTRTGFIVRP